MNAVTYSLLGKEGRLGNQLFQMSCCLGYAVTHGVEVKFPPWKYTEHFCVPSHVFVDSLPVPDHVDIEHRFTHSPIQFRPGVLEVRGYRQSSKYFEHCGALVNRWFSQRLELPLMNELCSVHVRRGDYVGNDCYVDLSIGDYYARAMSLFPGHRFTVFSDDAEFARRLFAHRKDVTIASPADEITHFREMLACRNHVIANSSFSWWAAYLSPDHGRVVAPREWFGLGLPRHSSRDLIPDGWTRV